MFWLPQPPVIWSTRAICLTCEQFYEAKHPPLARQFFCPHCKTMTGVPVRG